MTHQERKNRQIATFELAVGVQIAEYGAAGIPESIYRQLERRAKELDLELDDYRLGDQRPTMRKAD